MAGEGMLNFDPTAGETPPQAPAPTDFMPGLAALTDIAPAPTAVGVLRPAAYGDTGAQQYQALQNAGNMQPNPSSGIGAGLAGLASSLQSGLGSLVPGPTPYGETSTGGFGSDLMQLGSDFFMGAAGHPEMGLKAGAARAEVAQHAQAARLAEEKAFRDNVATFYDQMMPKIFDAFPGRPDLAAGVLQRAGTQMGLETDPAILIMARQRQKDGEQPQGTYTKMAQDPSTPLSELQRWGKDAKAAEEGRQASFLADKAKEDAQRSLLQTEAEPQKLEDEATKRAIATARDLQKMNAPGDLNQLKNLDAAGFTRWQVPVPNVSDPNAKMWMFGPKATAPAAARDNVTNALAQYRQGEATQAGALALAKEEATTTSTTRTMREAAPKVRATVDKALAALNLTETGPLKGRWKEAMVTGLGTSDPNFTKLKRWTNLLAKLMMRMHVGARGGEQMAEAFRKDFADAVQSPDNFRAALEVARDYADIVDHSPEGVQITKPKGAGAGVTTVGGGAGAPGAGGGAPGGATVIDYGSDLFNQHLAP